MSEKPVPPPPPPPRGGTEEGAAGSAQIRKRSVKIAGHSTSLSLEGIFWDALKEVAAGRGLSLNALIEEIDRGRGGNLSSAVRVYLLQHYRAAGQPPETGPETCPETGPETSPRDPSEDPSRLP
jgi:predicted DNA-binding ribbon-helix-helix protein